MNTETLTFLNEYKTQLQSIDSVAHVYDELSTWSFRQRHQIAGIVEDLNDCLRLRDGSAFKDHILTTAVGDLSGLLFVSANPGWNSVANGKEDNFRSTSIQNNREFCTDFFRTYKRVVGSNRWWSRALLLSHMVVTGAPVPPASRWDWALQGVTVGNVDLLPFHSTADKFGVLSHDSDAHQAMRSIAIATIEMALRLKPAPRLIFVGSRLGAPIADALCEELGMEFQPAQEGSVAQFNRLRRYVHPVTSARVMTFPYQPFAGYTSQYLPTGFMDDLATHIRDFAHPRF